MTAVTGRGAWARPLLVIGATGLVVGTIDPLEGAVLILAGVALITLAAFLGGSRHRRILTWALALLSVGVAAVWISSLYGGFGDGTGRSLWWLVPVLAPYLLGWLLGVVGTVLAFREFFRRSPRPAREDDANGDPRSGAVK